MALGDDYCTLRTRQLSLIGGALHHFTNMPSRSAFLYAAEQVPDPMLVVYGANTPRRSKGEMEVLAALKNVRAVQLSVGKLSIHEEFPDLVAGAIRSFLERDPRQEVARSAPS